MSTSSPAINRNMTDAKYSKDDSPPRYQDLPSYSTRPSVGGGRIGGVTSGLSSTGYTSSAMVLGIKGHSLLQKKQAPQTNGHSPGSGMQQQQQQQPQRQPLQLRSSVPMNGYLPMGKSDPSLLSITSKSSPTPSATNFTSASVLVLYLGPVEIPDAWSKRELSSKCLQECTRNLLSQRQDFVEAFLEVTLTSMRILAVSQTELFKHRREELYYAGVCTDDELYFGIVTRKVEHKSNKKSLSSGSGSSKVNRAHMCHVFKVIEQKSVLMLHSGAPKDSKPAKSNKQQQQQQQLQNKQKTIPISSSVTIVTAIQGLFTSPGTKILDDVVSCKISSGSAENVLSGCSQDKLKKKKLDVVDLRPSAYSSSSPLPSSSSSSTGLIGSGLNSITQTTANMYVAAPYNAGSIPNNRATSGVMINHVRSQSNPANTSPGPGMPPPDYPRSIGTPAFHQQGASKRHGGSNGGGGGGLGVGGGGGGSGTSWYASDSPKEEHLSRTETWDAKGTSPQGRRSGGRSPMGGGYDRNDGYYRHDSSPGVLGGHRHRGIPSSSSRKANQSPFQGDMVRRFSDDSSISSSLSDSRASSPTRISHRSSFTSHSRSPSPHRSLSFSSRSRTPSPLPPARSMLVRPQGHSHKPSGGSRMSASTRKARMEVGMSIRAASRASAMSVNTTVPLRRQVSRGTSGRGSQVLPEWLVKSVCVCVDV